MQTVTLTILHLSCVPVSAFDVLRIEIAGGALLLMIAVSHWAVERTLVWLGFTTGWEHHVTHQLIRLAVVLHAVVVITALACVSSHELMGI